MEWGSDFASLVFLIDQPTTATSRSAMSSNSFAVLLFRALDCSSSVLINFSRLGHSNCHCVSFIVGQSLLWYTI